MNGRKVKIIDGSANTPLTDLICQNLEVNKVDILVDSFSDGETQIEIRENMRGCDVFVIQPISPPVNEHLVQLCLILDALKRSNCWRITAVIPYYGYARQDKKLKPRVPISAKAVADIIQSVGLDRVLTLDLHANQIQGYFNCPVDNLFASSIFCDHIQTYLDEKVQTVIVSPDVGGVARAVHYSKQLGLETAIIHKSRPMANQISEMVLLGSVRNCNTILIDDMIDTTGTLCKASRLLKDAGALKVEAYATHGIFSGNAYSNIEKSKFTFIHVTDSIKRNNNLTTIKTVSCAKLLADAILSIHNETSVSCLFK